MGPWETLLLLTLIVILVVARRLVRLGSPAKGPDYRLPLWVAQGFGLGRIPWAPGTFGSAGGVLWLIVLLEKRSLALFILAAALAIALSVWACGVAERVMRQKDPSSVVLDEIVAVPICFLGWIGVLIHRTGALPPPEYFFSRETILFSLGIFVLFRLFDIAKPWPLRQSQSFPGGWGITVDDLLAAVYVNGVVLAVFLVKRWI